MATYLFVWTSEMRSGNQGSEHKSDIWRTVAFLPTLAPANCVQIAPRTGKQLPSMEQGGRGWVAATMLRAQID